MSVPLDDLVRRHQQGQPGAFEALYNRCKDYAYRVAFFMTRNSGEAEKIVQDTFTDLLRALPRHNARGSACFETWLYRAILKRSRGPSQRGRAPSADWDEVVEQLDPSPNGGTGRNSGAITLRQERGTTLWQAIDALPDVYREVIILRYQADLSYDEIAQVLNLSHGTVKSRLYQAHKKLGETQIREVKR